MTEPVVGERWHTETRSVGGLHVIEQRGRGEGHDRLPVIVLIHGAMDRATSFARTARLLVDHAVVRYDRRGYGKSIHLAPGDIGQQVIDLDAVLHGRPAVLIGHSMGGAIALGAAERMAGQILAVGAYEAPMPWTDWWPSGSLGDIALGGDELPNRADSTDPAGDAAERFMRAMLGGERWGRLPVRTRQQRREEGPALVADLKALRTPSAPFDLARLTLPIVAAYGTEGSDRHRQAAEHLAAEAPAGELRVIPGAGHGVHLSHPKAYADFVLQTLARVAR